MAGYKDLEIFRISFDLAVSVHKMSLQLPAYEKFELGSQIRRSSKSIYAQIAEGYGRRRYKQDFIKFLTNALASGDECISHIMMINQLYPEQTAWEDLLESYEMLGRKINKYIQYVENEWNKF
ncbi:MAG: four helix bundle protein [Bacteroidetes bacterium]|nr:four helix bundle protein [Bacteroidota bacterium]